LNAVDLYSLKAPGFNHYTYHVRNWFQAFAFTFNSYRYTEVASLTAVDISNGMLTLAKDRAGELGLRVLTDAEWAGLALFTTLSYSQNTSMFRDGQPVCSV
jgi:hypothetical protein